MGVQKAKEEAKEKVKQKNTNIKAPAGDLEESSWFSIDNFKTNFDAFVEQSSNLFDIASSPEPESTKQQRKKPRNIKSSTTQERPMVAKYEPVSKTVIDEIERRKLMRQYQLIPMEVYKRAKDIG